MKVFIQSILFFICSCAAAQNSLIDQLHAMQKDVRLKEKIYIHTNKTSYFTDDIVWFKCYVGDSSNNPSASTTKLYVNLIDGQGSAIYQKNILIEKGSGFGQFEFNDALEPGTYFIQAYTNYMRNFGDDYYHLKEIKILGEVLEKKNLVETSQYDVQLLPESGYLLENVKNIIGIKVLVNGMGMDFSGDIKNVNGESVSTFNSEYLGMTKCKLLYSTGEVYTANITINDTILKIKVPTARKKGIVLHVEANADDNYVNFDLSTNKATFNNKDYSDYSLLFHQNRQIIDLISLTRFDSVTGTIRMKKSHFLNGVNSVVLFKNDVPFAERKFFIEKNQKNTIVEIEEVGIENDSALYKLNVRSGKVFIDANLSVAVLPVNSEALKEKQNIRSAFLLTPFLRGYIENPAYYFDFENKKRKEHLDLLLLTQGWTQYNLNEMIEQLNPVPKFKFEYGFELKGNVRSPIKYDSIALISDDFRVIDKINLNEDYSFAFKNLLLYKEDTTKVAFIDELGKIIKPEKIEYNSTNKQNTPIAKIPFKKNHYRLNESSQQTSDKGKKYSFDPKNDNTTTALDGTILLEEAIVIEKRRSQRYLDRRKILEKYKPVVFDIGRYYNIPIPEVFIKYDHGLLNYLKSQGIREIGDNPLDIYYVNPASRRIIVQIDGRLILPEELSGLRISMKEIENILVSNSGSINGRLVSGPIYQVFTKKKYGNQVVDLFNEHQVKNGYDRSKSYYTPLYYLNSLKMQELSEIDWKPYLRTSCKGEVTFKIANNHKVKELQFSIQGFSSEGHLISKTIIAN